MKIFCHKNRNLGFTFIELMFAVVILSFGLTFVMRSFLVALKSFGHAQNIQTAAYILEDKMETIREEALKKGGIEIGKTQGLMEVKIGKVFSWQVNSVMSDFSKSFNQVRLSVGWQEQNQEQQLSAVIYLNNFEKK